jgi:NAD(P)-dependent dehydrogenase (short-subunit alcohol dehydrogenase family)
MARHFAAGGGRVVVADIDEDAGEAVASAVGGLFIRTDVTREEDNRAAVAAALAEFGGLDLILLNAGTGGDGDDFSLEGYRRTLAVNLDGTMFGLRAALPASAATGGGAVVGTDGETATGSVHVLDLPSAAAARAFAFDGPNCQAGVYRDVLLRRWHNQLGRTMWDFPGGRVEQDGYLVLGLGTGPAGGGPPAHNGLIAYGPLLSDDGDTWLGTGVLLQAG